MSGPSAIAVTGLGTFVGRRIAKRLAAREAAPRLVGADLRRPLGLPESLAFHEVDLTAPGAGTLLAEVLAKEAADVVLHAGFRRSPTPDREADHELDALGTLHVLSACAAAGVRRVVVASTTMVYGPHPDNPGFLTEAHPARGHPPSHAVEDRVEAERLVREFAGSHPDVETTILRPCWIMGPDHDSPVLRYFERPVVPVVLGYDPMFQFVHESDCLRAFEIALLEGRPGIYDVVGRGVAPLSHLLRSAGRRVLPVPGPLLDRVGWLPSELRTGDPARAFTDFLRYTWVADGSRGFAAFGEPAYTTREAWMSFVSSRRMRQYR